MSCGSRADRVVALLLLLLLGVFGLIAVTVVAGNEDEERCDRQEVQQGCTVSRGHAQCESLDLAASVHGLPVCVTKITISLLAGPLDTNVFYKTVELSNVNFRNLTRLQKVSIDANRANIRHVILIVNDPRSLQTLGRNVRILRIKACQISCSRCNISFEFMKQGMYGHLKSLEVLDLTRARRLGLDTVRQAIGQQPLMETLILKNVQQLANVGYVYNVDLAWFICKGNVRHLDLSFNDLVTLTLPSECSSSKIRYLNLDHNILSMVDDSALNLLSQLTLFSALETLHGSMWAGGTYQKGLWEDDDSVPGDTNGDDTNLSLVSKLLQHSSLSFLTDYDVWFTDVLEHCGNIGYVDLVRCVVQGDHEDLCALFQCVVPMLDIQDCPRDKKRQLEFFAAKMCSYKACDFNIQLPLPPKLKSVTAHNLGKTGNGFFGKLDGLNASYCIHPHNSLEVVDLSGFTLSASESFPYSYSVSGLHKLKYLNLHGINIPIFLSNVVLLNADSLEELHIGGAVLAEDNVLPGDVLSTYTKLSLLNLTDASLVGIEAHAFRNLQDLSVLDLSHNSLNSSSLLYLELSQTRLKNLDLSHNELTDIPASMREQLDGMEGLELYLSGNKFICNCDNLEFLQWIQGSKSTITFHYAGDHVCVDSPGNTIHNIDVDSMHCNWYWMQPVIAVASSLALSLLFIVLFTLYRKRWFMSNLLFRMQERFCTSAADGNDTSYKYDAFILYSSVDDDRQWVHYKLVHELEDVYGVRLCVHHRDFLAGRYIADNIEDAIRSSRKVVAVLSENFLRSDWCINEVHMTRAVDRRKLIVLMYKGIPLTGAPVPTVIERLLASRTYIEWHETPDQAQKLFWKKLRRALFSKKRHIRHESPSVPVETDQHAYLI